ncbi:MAG: AraC family transcriptional regulator [Bacteroidales bacterium]
MKKDHSLVYIYSGEYILEEGGVTTVVEAGECVFLRKDNRIIMTKQPKGDESFRGIFMVFKRSFLREVFQKIEKKDLPLDVERHKTSVMKLPYTPDIASLFQSMVPYFNTTIIPPEELMNLKLLEGIYSLLNLDKNFYTDLFDFNAPWKPDILDFLNENYMYDLSIEEIAHFTGRRLATFKREFKRISTFSPHKWLMIKRLDVARGKLLNEKKKVSDVYLEVGFKDLSHFSRVYKETYGASPTGI